MTRSRREFFRSLSAAAALPTSWAAFTQSLRASAGAPEAGSEAYWQMVKRQFPLEEKLLYLNAANVCPVSHPVMDRYLEYLRDFQRNPSFQNREKYKLHQERLRAKLATLLGCSADEIAVTRNTSEGNNVVVNGVDLKPGDEVLITDHNHPSNKQSWKVRASRQGFVVRSLPVPVPAPSREHLLSAFEKAITSRTKIIAITHVTNTTGILYPAREIAELARRRGIWMHLDGAQTFGAIDVNLRQIGCDSYAASSHKWSMGPLEAGVLYVREERIAGLWPSIVTAGWSDHLVGARKFEVLGQRDNPRVVAFEAAVEFIRLIGMSNVEARMRALATSLKQKLAQIPRVRLKTNLEPELSAGVIKFHLLGVATPHAYDTLWTKHRVALAMTTSSSPANQEGLRFCPHIYNSRDELDRAAGAVRELIS
jgi:selenocysteine lyase/cysteine desulfurase